MSAKLVNQLLDRARDLGHTVADEGSTKVITWGTRNRFVLHLKNDGGLERGELIGGTGLVLESFDSIRALAVCMAKFNL